MPTIYDIAKALNINASTVSRALNNPELVSEKTRRNVVSVAKEIGYTPNLVASQLRTAKSNIIGVISLEPVWLWFTDMVINGIEQKAKKLGYDIIILSSNKNYKDTVGFCEQLHLAGAIIVSTEIRKDTEEIKSSIPLVCVNRKNVSNNLIMVDDEHGIKMALKHLFEMGHTDIGCLKGPKQSLHSELRYNAYQKYMQRQQLPVNQAWCTQAAGWYREDGYKAAKKILQRTERPTALLVGNDNLCVGVYDAARKMGIEVGKDLSVIGYDDNEWTSFVFPELTTVQMPLFKMGTAAVEMMVNIINQTPYKDKVIVKGSLIKRDSVARIN